MALIITKKQIGISLTTLSLLLILLLSIVKADLDTRDAFLCQATHTNPNLEMQNCPAHNTNTSWFVLAAFGISFLLLGAGLYAFFAPSSQSEKKKKVDLSKLADQEKKIYHLLKNNEGTYYQSDLIKETGLSKVKMTRLLDKLEAKKIIDRKRRGMTNIIVLK